MNIKQYLDSSHGRHLIGREKDAEYIKKDFSKFAKAYESCDSDKEGELNETSCGTKKKWGAIKDSMNDSIKK